jgi:hypothetical protein
MDEDPQNPKQPADGGGGDGGTANPPPPPNQPPEAQVGQQTDAKPAPKSDPTAEIAQIQAAIEKIETEYQIAVEWGLFLTPSNPNTGLEVIADLEKRFSSARSACNETPPNLVAANTAVVVARRILSTAQCADGNYRANNIFAICPIFITVIATSVVYIVGVECLLGLTGEHLFHHPVFWGLVGATLRSFFWIQRQASRGWLRPRFFPTFVVSPALGIILGAASALVMKVGTTVVAGSNSTANWATIALVAFWAGYKWDWALQAMEGAATQLVPELKKPTPAAASATATATVPSAAGAPVTATVTAPTSGKKT